MGTWAAFFELEPYEERPMYENFFKNKQRSIEARKRENHFDPGFLEMRNLGL